jgi:hypothetical protein
VTNTVIRINTEVNNYTITFSDPPNYSGDLVAPVTIFQQGRFIAIRFGIATVLTATTNNELILSATSTTIPLALIPSSVVTVPLMMNHGNFNSPVLFQIGGTTLQLFTRDGFNNLGLLNRTVGWQGGSTPSSGATCWYPLF